MYGYSAVALFAGLAVAAHAPVGDPKGNPITAPLNEIVPACKPFTIKWQPTTYNKVSLIFLKGPSTNVVPYGPPIVEGIDNSGSYVWTPPSGLEPGTSGYGIQLIDDVTGQYQYSTQFGISNDACSKSSSSAPSSSKATSAPSYAQSTPVVVSTSCNSSSIAAPTSVGTSAYVASTGLPPSNSSIVLPTKSMSVPNSLLTTATPQGPTGGSPATASASAPAATGAAAKLGAGFGLVGAVAGMVFML